ncbi:MAG: hypothetical protein Q8O00_16935, partial [Holophaga sp.]|nr:hypothetical protein [Holophaga sp.]
MELVQAEWLLGEMSRQIDFVKTEKKEIVGTHPTKLFAQIVIGQTQAPWPLLRAVVKAPLILPKGQVLTQPGFDVSSGIYLANKDSWPDFSKKVDEVAARAAWLRLKALIQDFPFGPLGSDQGPDASEAAWLGLCLTLLCRFAFVGSVPFFVFNGNKAGVGKGKLLQLASLIVLGSNPYTMPASEDLDKFTQDAYSALRSGTRLCWMDDVNPQFGNRVLNMVITAEEVAARKFFTQDLCGVPNMAVWAITANDVCL